MIKDPRIAPLFIGSEIYRRSSYGAWHPLRVPRVSTVIDLSRAMGWLGPKQYVQSPKAKAAALSVWHDPVYVEALQRAELTQAVSDQEREAFGLGTMANPVFPEMWQRPATSAGASLLAGELLAKGGVIYSPAGGTHHGMPARANGFCYLNDPVLAILSLRRTGVRRIAYIDIDAHHPDGVEVAFGQDPDVLMISVHEENRWPRTGGLIGEGAGSLFNLPVPAGLNDSEMSVIRDQLILPAVEQFAPDAIVLQCGADAVTEDPLSRLTLSNNSHWAIVRALMSMSPRYLVLGGGGYNPWSVGRLWTGVWATLNGQHIPSALPPVAVDVLRGLRFDNHRLGRNPPEHWYATLRDEPRNGEVRGDILERLARLTARFAVQI
ncbi:acetoin utilization protein AcuC [Donghicola sp. XS_ASV15]|uniref:acetoin utilization protein AcuC n=1 Tax=Donghicola sp. XS_ASV15 TaxID=3241295 RepID=UPI003515B47A